MAERRVWDGDQADGLRRLFSARGPQVVAFASGTGAGGRTTLVARTASALAAAGHATVVVDESPAPDNALSTFGLASRHDFLGVIRGECSLAQVAIPAGPLLRIVPAARAAREFDRLGTAGWQRLAAAMHEMEHGAGFVLIDAASRRGGGLSALAASARHLIVVVAGHGAAITDAYALIKRVAQEYGRDSFHVVFTHARTRDEARAMYENLRHVARDHLGVRLGYLGTPAVPVADHAADALLRCLPPAVVADAIDAGGQPISPGALPAEFLDSVL